MFIPRRIAKQTLFPSLLRGPNASILVSGLTRRPNSSASPPPPSLDLDTTLTPPQPNPEPGQELANIIRQTIDATGPMPLQRYMMLCLNHATLGYYTRGDVFGKKGDFITSPEISQVFGELLAIYLLTRWQANGSPSKVRIIELGPGRGTLVADVIRTFKAFPPLANAMTTIDLVETSPVMRELQKVALDKVGLPPWVEVRWFDWVEEIDKTPDTFTFFLAHEFFDALPIHLLQRQGPHPTSDPSSSSDDPKPSPFHELLVTYTPPSTSLHLTLSKIPTAPSLFLPTTSPHFDSVPEPDGRVEICPEAVGIMQTLGELIGGEGSGGGSGLVVDYGQDGWSGNSFRAFQNHLSLSPFANPGLSDLTANVDFTYLRSLLSPVVPSSILAPIRALGPITQGDFLTSMGLGPRVQALIDAEEDESVAEQMMKGAERLVGTTEEKGMGEEYMVMGVECGVRGQGGGGNGEVYPFEGK